MDYTAELKKIEGITGAVVASLVGIDGISLSSYTTLDEGEMSVVDAELATLMTYARQSIDNVNAGEIIELVVFTTKFSFIMTFVGKEYFLYIGLQGQNANIGKARNLLYELRKVFYKDIYESL